MEILEVVGLTNKKSLTNLNKQKRFGYMRFVLYLCIQKERSLDLCKTCRNM